MKIGRFKQTPIEHRRYTVDYSQWLDIGETLSGTSTIVADHVDVVPLTAVSVNYINGNTGITFLLSGGDDEEDYRVDITSPTTYGQIKEDYMFVEVRTPEGP